MLKPTCRLEIDVCINHLLLLAKQFCLCLKHALLRVKYGDKRIKIDFVWCLYFTAVVGCYGCFQMYCLQAHKQSFCKAWNNNTSSKKIADMHEQLNVFTSKCFETYINETYPWTYWQYTMIMHIFKCFPKVMFTPSQCLST